MHVLTLATICSGQKGIEYKASQCLPLLASLPKVGDNRVHRLGPVTHCRVNHELTALGTAITNDKLTR